MNEYCLITKAFGINGNRRQIDKLNFPVFLVPIKKFSIFYKLYFSCLKKKYPDLTGIDFEYTIIYPY